LISKEGGEGVQAAAESFVQVEYEEIATSSDYRTIRIPLEENDKWVEVIGTYVIPEFGSIVIIILVVAVSSAIISIIVVTAKTRLSIVPRY
jgi:predicted secreted protein with PEFG-CTERM motif